jgi:hypothetical protein
MMEESPEAASKREEMLRMYHACKESLRIIGESLGAFDLDLLLIMFLLRWRHNGHVLNTSSSASQEWLVADWWKSKALAPESGRSTQECSGTTGEFAAMEAFDFCLFFLNSFLSRDQWEARQDEALLLLQLVADLRQLFPIDQEVKSKTIKHKHHKLTRLHQQVQPHQFQAVAQLVRHCQHHSFHRKYSNVLIVVSIAEPRTNL